MDNGKLTAIVGMALMALGIVGYVATGRVSVTALIPTFFGLPMTLLGRFSMSHPNLRKHLIHVAVVLAVIGAAGSARGFIALIGGTCTAATIAQTIMLALCLAYTVLCIRSFIAARKNKA